MSLQLIGVTRFSVDPTSIFSPEAANLSRLREDLYAADRLRRRLDIFENVTLKCLIEIAQEASSFRHVVYASNLLPADIARQLQDICRRHSRWLTLRWLGAGQSLSEELRAAIKALARSRTVFNFRIDDDDAINPLFVRDLRLNAKSLRRNTIVSLDSGYYLQKLEDSQYALSPMTYPGIGIGLGVCVSPDEGHCVFDLPVHSRIAAADMVCLSLRPYWIRMLHQDNDSGTRMSYSDVLDASQVEEKLQADFPFLFIERALLSLRSSKLQSRDKTAQKILFHIQ